MGSAVEPPAVAGLLVKQIGSTDEDWTTQRRATIDFGRSSTPDSHGFGSHLETAISFWPLQNSGGKALVA